MRMSKMRRRNGMGRGSAEMEDKEKSGQKLERGD
jgi:hypothetical protein